ncbi:MAG TPA: hypothetical protein PLJ47_12190 [Candidatus Hydrogenedentes bacterium]|nr:hypothetical protein [Candidatus Hydrogenedentota bacterium]
MKRTLSLALYLAISVALLPLQLAQAHPGHHHHDKATGAKHSHTHSHDADAAENNADGTLTLAQADATATAPASVPGVTGQGDYKFKLLYKGDHLPAEAVAVLTKAHGGFAVDRREGKGEIYFALPGAGIIEISADLAKTRMIPTPATMKDTNLHNAGIWYNKDAAYLVFPGNDVGKVFTTTIDGTLVNTLDAPTADFDFDEPVVNKYFDEGGKFVPTDVAKLGGRYYITTGYSPLDYVLTANVARANPEKVAWSDLAFGGKGTNPGQFGTGHGVTISPDGKHVTIADRPNAEIDRFTRFGHYRDTVKLPEGSLACDIDYMDELAIVGCLNGPAKDKGAPIYILKGDAIVSTLMPKEDLGLPNFTHIHNATFTKVGDKIYVIAQAWNPGDFAILEQVK